MTLFIISALLPRRSQQLGTDHATEAEQLSKIIVSH